jgi:tetratricopeptide (TPR) repeat protein
VSRVRSPFFWAGAGLAALFALAAILRWNGFSLLEPDSPEYLFGARSLATLQGYRDIDRPGAPLQTLRPPGLSLLLAPLTLAASYPVIAAKGVVLLTSLAALALTMRLAARDGPPWAPLAAGLLVATSPYALLHATEIVTELPYVACATAAILLMTRRHEAPTRREMAATAFLLAFLPFLRTIGLALVIASALWCALDRSRRAWWPAPAAAAGVSALWMMRNGTAHGPTYLGAIAAEWARSGASGLLARAASATTFYLARFADVLLPGVRAGRPLYERMIVGGAPDLGGALGAGAAVAVAAVALAARGAWLRRRRDGLLIALYAAGFLAVLVIYPPRHERLLWPLVPVVWSLVPAGLAKPGRAAIAVAAALGAALVAWQSAATAAIVRDNLAWARGGERFYAERVPPIYFADWRAAGAWIRHHAPAGATVLTRHSDVGFTSGLAQESIRFEEVSPQAWRARIAKLRARYLVVPATLYGKLSPLDLAGADPAYSYAVRYRSRDAAVVEVMPNRTGLVREAAAPVEASSACDRALAREPARVDLIARCAELLAACGRRDEAIARLDEAAGRGRDDVRIEIARGQLLLDAGKSAPAAEAFRRAADLPEADLLAQTIERGRAAAARGEGAPGEHLSRARGFADALRWKEASAETERALAESPGDPAATALAAEIALRLGSFDEALRLYAVGDTRSQATGRALAAALAVEASFDHADAAAVAAAAAFWAGAGAPGRALDLLERGAMRFPGDARIAGGAGEIRRFYGLD